MISASASSSIHSSELEEEHVLDAHGSTSACLADSVEPNCTIVRKEMSEFAAEMARWLAWQSDEPKRTPINPDSSEVP